MPNTAAKRPSRREAAPGEGAPWAPLLQRAERLLEQLESLLPGAEPVDWTATAYRWRKKNGSGYLQAVRHAHAIRPRDLQGIDAQKKAVEQNTMQFCAGVPANNVLLTGARGTGKSSLVKAMLTKYAPRGLRLVEVDKSDLVDLSDIVDLLAERTERFIIFCDDLSFEADEPGYKALKVALDGSIASTTENVVIYATSNRRHLMPEFMSENLATRHLGEEIHPGEAIEEKIALSERFGLWVSFYPFEQEEYLDIVAHWVNALGQSWADTEEARREALQWALSRGSRSGRVAYHFARHWVGAKALKGKKRA